MAYEYVYVPKNNQSSVIQFKKCNIVTKKNKFGSVLHKINYDYHIIIEYIFNKENILVNLKVFCTYNKLSYDKILKKMKIADKILNIKNIIHLLYECSIKESDNHFVADIDFVCDQLLLLNSHYDDLCGLQPIECHLNLHILITNLYNNYN